MVRRAGGVPTEVLKSGAPAVREAPQAGEDDLPAGLAAALEAVDTADGGELDAKRRGRPTSASARRVCTALLDAAERSLETKPYAEITVREVAAAAGVNAAMVNYYFQSKDGLFVALIEFLFADWSARLREIEHTHREDSPSPTRHFVAAVRDCFYRHRSVLWLIDREIGRSGSAIGTAFKTRLASTSTQAIRRFLQAMGERGVYRRAAEPRFLAHRVAAIAIHPIVFAQRLEPSYGIRMDELEQEPWLRALEQDLDRLLRP